MDNWVRQGGLDRAVNRENRRLRRKYTNKKRGQIIPRYLPPTDKNNLKRNMLTLGEKKYFTASISTLSVTDTAAIFDLCNIAQGGGDSERNGDQLTLRSFEMRYDVVFPLVTPDGTNLLRVIVFQWHPNSTPTAATLLISSVTQPWNSPYAHDSRFQFKILYDKTVKISLNGPAVASERCFIKSINKRKVQYNSGGNVGTEKLYLLVVSNSAAVGHPIFDCVYKTNYSDQ